jgi:DNA repair exonuclease SbcCD ATPase subunit
MRLRKVILKNVCQHADREISFGQGLTVVCGENGAGKSNLIAMIRVSITNDFASLVGNKQDNIRRGIRPNEPSFVKTFWETHAGTVEICRALQSSKSYLKLNDVILVEGKENDITASALELFGLTANMVNDFLFASQETLQETVAGTKSKRAAVFQSLCGLDVLSRLDGYLQQQISQDNAAVSMFNEQSHALLEQQWLTAKTNYKNAKATLAENLSVAVSDSDYLAASQLIRNHTQYVELRRQYNAVAQAGRDNQAKLVTVLQKITTYEEEEATLEKQIADAQTSLSSYLSGSLSKMTAEGIKLCRTKALAPKPTKPKTEYAISLENAIKVEASVSAMVVAAKNNMDQFNLPKDAVCPTCNQPFPENRIALSERAKEEWQDRKRQHKEAEEILERARQYDKEVKEHEKLIVEYDRSQLAWNEIVDAWGDSPEDVALQMQQQQTAKQQADLKLRQTRSNKSSEQVSKGSYEAKIAAAKSDIETLKAKLTGLSQLSADKLAELTQLVERYDSEKESLDAMRRELQSFLVTAKTTAAALRVSLRMRRQTAAIRQFIELLEQLRDVLKKDRLPARIVEKMLTRVTVKIDEYLELLGLNFRVTLDSSEFAFTVTHANGDVEPASRLSSGQQLGLAIAFWLARSAVFVGKVPFFCLDEPTARLDEERVLRSVGLFRQLSDLLAASNRQGVIITHHKALANVGNFVEI